MAGKEGFELVKMEEGMKVVARSERE